VAADIHCVMEFALAQVGMRMIRRKTWLV
jgi:hypothetical protein